MLLVVLLSEAQRRQCGDGAGQALGLGLGLPVDGVVLRHVHGFALVHLLGQCVGCQFVEHAVLALGPVLLRRRHVGGRGLAVQYAHCGQHADGYGLGLAVERVPALLLLVVGYAGVVAHADAGVDQLVAVRQLVVHLEQDVVHLVGLSVVCVRLQVVAGLQFQLWLGDVALVDGAHLHAAWDEESYDFEGCQVVPILAVGGVLPFLELHVAAPHVGSVDLHFIAALGKLRES